MTEKDRKFFSLKELLDAMREGAQDPKQTPYKYRKKERKKKR